MKIDKRTVWLSISGLILAGAIYLFITSLKSQHDWTPSLTKGGKEPYQLDVFYSLLTELNAHKKPEENKIPFRQFKFNSKKHYNYLFAASAMDMNEEDADSLISFISKGNTAFISTQTLPWELHTKLWATDSATLAQKEAENYQTNYIYTSDTAYRVHFIGDAEAYNFKFLQKYGYIDYNWQAFSEELRPLVLYPFTPLAGSKDKGWSYSYMQIGKGKLYLHTTPVTLANVYLCTPNGFKYLNQLFADFPKGELILDHYHHISREDENGNTKPNTPLSYLLTQAPLRWTWYLGLMLSLVFIFFYGKRKSAPIPLLYKIKNTSVEYAKTIGLLYQSRKQHREIISLKMRHLKHFIKDRYRLIENNNPEMYIAQLAKLSGINEEIIQKIMTQGAILERKQSIADIDMVNFQKQVDEFYKNCK